MCHSSVLAGLHCFSASGATMLYLVAPATVHGATLPPDDLDDEAFEQYRDQAREISARSAKAREKSLREFAESNKRREDERRNWEQFKFWGIMAAILCALIWLIVVVWRGGVLDLSKEIEKDELAMPMILLLLIIPVALVCAGMGYLLEYVWWLSGNPWVYWLLIGALVLGGLYLLRVIVAGRRNPGSAQSRRS